MRALATADSAQHREHATARAQRRRAQPPARALQLAFRNSRWPAWVATGDSGELIFERGMLQLDDEARGGVPAADSDAYRMVVREAYLLAGRQLPVELDGRKLMALRHERTLDPAPRRSSPGLGEQELAEPARRTGEPASLLRRLSPAYRERWLIELRRGEARRARTEMLEFRDRLANLTDDPDRR